MCATVVNVLIALTNFFVARATYMGTGGHRDVRGGGSHLALIVPAGH